MEFKQGNRICICAFFDLFLTGKGWKERAGGRFGSLTLEQDGLDSVVDKFERGLDTDGLVGSIAMGQPNCIGIVLDMDGNEADGIN